MLAHNETLEANLRTLEVNEDGDGAAGDLCRVPNELNNSCVLFGLTVAAVNTRDIHAGVNQLLDLLGGGRRGA